MKKLICILMCMMLTLPFGASVLALDSDGGALPEKGASVMQQKAASDEVEFADAMVIEMKNIYVFPDGTICEMREGPECEMYYNDTDGPSERIKTKTFTYVLTGTGGVYLATATATVTGVYSQADGYAYLTSITASFTGPAAYMYTWSSSISGDTGSLDLILDSTVYITLHYKIYPNGTIQHI